MSKMINTVSADGLAPLGARTSASTVLIEFISRTYSTAACQRINLVHYSGVIIGCNCVSNHQPHDCFLNRLFGRRSKKTSTLRVIGLCADNSPVIGKFPAQMASNAENVSIWWRPHDACNPGVDEPASNCIRSKNKSNVFKNYLKLSMGVFFA